MRQRYNARGPFALLLAYPRRWLSGLAGVPWFARRLLARRPLLKQ
jgi:hypothetical protein